VGAGERYPRLDEALRLRPEVVLLPSEPYTFGDADLPAVAGLVPGVPTRFVDGRLLTWHGPSTAGALREFTGLAAALARARSPQAQAPDADNVVGRGQGSRSVDSEADRR
jgi:hypothetical protein